MRIPVKQSADSLKSWLSQLQKQIAELKPDNGELQEKLNLLQLSLQKTLDDQAKQQAQQIQCQKQIALLRNQIVYANHIF